MALESRDSIRLQDLCFKLHNSNKICDIADVCKGNKDLVSSSSANGLLFVGDPVAAKLKAFFVSDLVKSKATGMKVLARTVSLAAPPNIVACNCDGSMVAVNYTHNISGYIQIFSVPSFISSDIQTVYNIRIMPDETATALQILWNPVNSNMFAAVLDNGYFAMYQLKDDGVLESEMHCFQKGEPVQCACWSPKGRQIVLGFMNGKLQQYKHDLTMAKTIPCPPSIYPMPFDTAAVSWLSAHQFIVAFVNKTETKPAIFIVNAGKGDAPAAFIRYPNVCSSCLSSGSDRIHITHLPQWSLLLITCGNSWNVDVMCANYDSDIPVWKCCQFQDDARPEIPQSGSQTDVFPIGVALDTATTHQLSWNDQVLPPMPMLHFLSTQGQLVSYDFINLNLKAPRLCTPPPLFLNVSTEFQPIDKRDYTIPMASLLSEKTAEYKPIAMHEVLEIIPPAAAPVESTRKSFIDAEAQAVEDVEEEPESMPCWKESFITTPNFLIGSAVIVGVMFVICVIVVLGVVF